MQDFSSLLFLRLPPDCSYKCPHPLALPPSPAAVQNPQASGTPPSLLAGSHRDYQPTHSWRSKFQVPEEPRREQGLLSPREGCLRD